MDIEIEGDMEADTGVRFANYHSAISVARNDSIHGLSAKGLTGERYNNFVWWDCEIYQLPIFIYTAPETAKKALLYRYNTLNGARENARLEGRKGARYAFVSSVKGDEKVWEYARHPFLQVHITADVSWGIIHYFNVTNDLEFMKNYGLEILFECSRYWVDRVEFINDRYELRNVTGTDEHHPYVNNDAYTNFLVHLVLNKATQLYEFYKNEHVVTNIGLKEEETNKWREIAGKLYLPMIRKNGLIPQFDNYFDLSRTLERAGGSNATQFQMKASGLYHESQVIKQPDVMLLFAYLNIPFKKEVYSLNWDYYEQMCESSSSLSFSVHSICAADNGRMLSAYHYLLDTAYVDIRDIHNCGWQGIHSGCAAGAWYAVFRGIAGIICREDKIEINPHMMPWWISVKFKFQYKGYLFNVKMSNGEFCIACNSNEDIEIYFNGKQLSINSKNSICEVIKNEI